MEDVMGHAYKKASTKMASYRNRGMYKLGLFDSLVTLAAFTHQGSITMNIKNITIVCVATLGFSGCASITSSKMQPLTLSTKTADGKAVDKANCTLKNDKGAWELVSPGTVAVQRSAEDLMVECKKEGVADGFLRAISRAAGGMWGNIIFGGGIGAIIDHNTGTGYNYPNDLPVKMGESVTVDRRHEQQPTAQATDPNAPTK